MSNLNKNYLYSKDNCWIKLNNNIAEIGVIENFTKQADEFIFLGLPKLNSNIEKGKSLIAFESAKWTGEVSSPLSGKIIELNDLAFNNPKVINQSPYNVWLVKIKFDNKDELDDLMKYEEASKLYD
jgi:glycine cleavage system H protein